MDLSAVVGKTATALNRATTLETTMDNYLLQALRETTGAQLAFSTAGVLAPWSSPGRSHE
jgi:hypothetical protein